MNTPISLNIFLSLLDSEIKRNGGVSADINQRELLQPKNSWYFPKYSSKTRILPQTVDLLAELESFIKDNKKFLSEKDTFLGVWLNPQTKHYYLDITTSIDDLDLAKKKAKDISRREGRKIVSLYNPHTNKTIYLWKYRK